MHYEFEISLLCEEGFDHYQTVVVEASCDREAYNLAWEAMVANLGGYWVNGAVISGVQIEICTPGPKAPRTPSVPALRCGDHKFLTPTGRVLYGVEEAAPLVCEGQWEWDGRWVESPLAQVGNCP